MVVKKQVEGTRCPGGQYDVGSTLVTASGPAGTVKALGLIIGLGNRDPHGGGPPTAGYPIAQVFLTSNGTLFIQALAAMPIDAQKKLNAVVSAPGWYAGTSPVVPLKRDMPVPSFVYPCDMHWPPQS